MVGLTAFNCRVVLLWIPQHSVSVDGDKDAYTEILLPPTFLSHTFPWLPIYLIWRTAQVHLMTFILLNNFFLVVLSCNLLGLAWDFQQKLVGSGHSIQKVF